MRAFGRLLPIEVARRRLRAASFPIARTESVVLEAAGGRIAARLLRAPRPVPSVDRASWDGYAVRSRDSARASPAAPRRLRVVAELYAEQAARTRVGPGEAAAVATGASMPAGADAVAIFEEVRRRGEEIELERPVGRGERIGRAGHDIRTGTPLVRPGERIGPAHLGALGAAGIASVRVYARPIVGLLTSGNELQVPGSKLRRGGIYESNLAAMGAIVAAAGCEPRAWPPIRDDPAAIARALRTALRTCDVVLASGGSSVGERDHLPRIFPTLGHPLFHGLAVRPGKPTLAARAGEKLLVGLPGHPASCLLNMLWLVLPALRRRARLPGPGWSETVAPLRGPGLSGHPTMSVVVPLAYDGRTVRSTFRASSAVTSLTAANGFVILSPGAPGFRPGASVPFAALAPPLG